MKRLGLLALAWVCLTTTAQADWTSADDDKTTTAFDQAAELVVAGKYDDALQALKEIEASSPNDADVLNLIAFSHRKLGDLDAAGTHYIKALTIDPSHLGALEYQGELFITLGDMEAAQANLTRLESLCPTGCDELDALKEALAGS